MTYSSERGITTHDTSNSALKVHKDKGKAAIRNELPERVEMFLFTMIKLVYHWPKEETK